VRQREECETLGSMPAAREVKKALGKMKNGKAAGKFTILPEC